MPRESLDRKISALQEDILILDSMVENAVIESTRSLRNQDLSRARLVYRNDALVNKKRFEIENAVVIAIATQQPVMAGDLRLLASILEVAGELERMGDYAKGNARIALMIGETPHIKPLTDIARMAEIAVDMLHRSISAFISKDKEAAVSIPADDDEVDRLYNQVYIDVVHQIVANPNPGVVEQANFLIWAAHNLERLADRVANICERTVYYASGELKELAASDDEMMARSYPIPT